VREAFIERRFAAASLEMIDLANGILDEYEAQGFRLSLRQLYYQLVARGLLPNTVRSYKNLGSLVSDARLAGLIDWQMIEDRGRETVTPPHWNSPGQIIRSAARAFRIDKWADQDYHIEVMVEKDALSGVLVPVCEDLDVSLTANKGYGSSSLMYEIGKRLAEQDGLGKRCVILYLGDHDPSGIDMTRDVDDRLSLYSGLCSDRLEVVRLALNMNQIEEWQPPRNPAKETDARFASYLAEYGEDSWELDAVEPATLADLVRDAVARYRDDERWDAKVDDERRMRQSLLKFAATYSA
jgi:hypothetical protein